MEYTNDLTYNVKYSRNLGTLNLRRRNKIRRLKEKIIEFIKENKFITIVIISIIILTVVDMALVSAFMNLFVTL